MRRRDLLSAAAGAVIATALAGGKYVAFLIDPEGRVLQTFYRVKPADTVPKARAALAAGGTEGQLASS